MTEEEVARANMALAQWADREEIHVMDKPTVAFEILLALVRNMPEVVPAVLVDTAWSLAEAHMRRVKEHDAES